MASVETAEAILERAQDILLLGGIDLIETREIPYGWQLRGAAGEIVNIYTTGKAVAQGKNAAAVKALFDATALPSPARTAPSRPRNVAPPEPVQQAGRIPPGWSELWAEGDVPF